MNDKIRKLSEQAGFYFYDMHNVDGQDLGESVEADSFSAVDKFVELIIWECVAQCEKNYVGTVGTHASAHNSAVSKCVTSIKQHFGVQE